MGRQEQCIEKDQPVSSTMLMIAFKYLHYRVAAAPSATIFSIPNPSIMFIRLFGVLVSAFCAGQVSAQTPNDYYMASSTAATAELLKNVEGYHLAQGIQEMRDKRPHAAWADFDFMLRYFPNHPRALLLMGDVCEVWHNAKCDMESYLAKAVKMSPDNDGVYLAKGVYLQKRGRLKDAIESYKKSLELNASSANVHYNLGLAYVAAKQYELANEHAQKAYGMGMTFPGLQSKLVAVGAWKTIPPPVAASTDSAKADGDGDAPSEARQGTEGSAK
jgi:hypothetical protein